MSLFGNVEEDRVIEFHETRKQVPVLQWTMNAQPTRGLI